MSSLLTELARFEPGVLPPGAPTLGGLTRVQDTLNALLSSRLFAGVAEHLLIIWIRQVRRYFTEPLILWGSESRRRP
jgi:hypothetical protein